MESKTLPAPLHHVVGQLRELLSKVPHGQWSTQLNNYGTGVLIQQPDDFVNVCWWDCGNTYEHTEDCRDLIITAINSLPALLAIAEAAAVVSSQRNGPYLMADMDATMKAESDLRTALSLLPNPTDLPPGVPQPSQSDNQASPGRLHPVVGPVLGDQS